MARAHHHSLDRLSHLLVVGSLAAALLAAVPTPLAAAGPSCTAEQGQALIEAGRYQQAIRQFTCLIEAAPAEVEGYRGRIEAQLLIGRYSDAMADYGRVTAYVVPVHPDAEATILRGYAARLADAPTSIPALTGATFARWWAFDYPQAVQLSNELMALRPDDVFGNVFRGSSRVLQGTTLARGVADLERALRLAPSSADVRWIVADAYTYGLPDAARALSEATLALDWGLDTPRVHAILAAAHGALGDPATAAGHIERHLELVTTELITTSPLAVGDSLALDLVPGRTYAIPVLASAGQPIVISTGSKDFWDSIALLQAPDGSPAIGSDDAVAYFAAFDWIAPETGTYVLLVTSFEGINTGLLSVSRS